MKRNPLVVASLAWAGSSRPCRRRGRSPALPNEEFGARGAQVL